MKDCEIVRLFRERDEAALSEAKKKYESYCSYIAMNVLGDRLDAEECVNDALLAAWKSIPPHNPENLKAIPHNSTRTSSRLIFRLFPRRNQGLFKNLLREFLNNPSRNFSSRDRDVFARYSAEI